MDAFDFSGRPLPPGGFQDPHGIGVGQKKTVVIVQLVRVSSIAALGVGCDQIGDNMDGF